MADTTRKLNIWINGSQVENTFKSMSAAMFNSRNELAKMTIGSKEYIEQTKKIRQLQGLMDEHRKMQGQIATGWQKVKSGVLSSFAGNALANAASNISSKIIAIFSDAWTKIKEFSKGISELKAITGASGADLDFLKTKAIDLAAVYGTSAKEIVNAMKLVGSAKPELLSNVNALSQVTEAVLTLSKASSMDLATATESLTVIMNQFGHGAELANKDINILAAGSKYGAVEVDYLSQALTKVGTVMKSAGLSLEQGTAAMELFGEKGVKAEIAGTGFKSILVELQTDTKNYTNGVFDLNKAIDRNQSISSNNLELQAKFGKEYFNLAQILFQGKERFNELTTQITGTNTAFEQAAISMDNLSGDLDKAAGAWDKFVLGIENGSGPITKAIRAIVKGFSDMLGFFDQVNKGTYLEEKLKRDSGFLDQVNKRWDEYIIKLRMANSAEEEAQMVATERTKLQQKNRALNFTLTSGKENGKEVDARRKAELQFEIDAYTELIKRLEEYGNIKTIVNTVKDDEGTGSTTTGGTKTKKTGNLAKDEAKLLSEYYKNYESLQKSILDIRKKFNQETITEEEKAIEEINDSYDQQLSIVKNFIDELEAKKKKSGDLNQEENDLLSNFYDQQNTLVEMNEADILATKKKFADKSIEEKKKVQQQINEILMSSEDKELQETVKKYEQLISLAEQYGFETVDLYRKMQEEIDKIIGNNITKKEDKPDIFGMTSKDWSKTQENFQKVMAYADQAKNAFAAWSELQTNKDNQLLADYEANTEKKKTALENQLKHGVISQQKYDSEVSNLNKKLDNEKKKLAIEGARRQKALRIYDTVTNTAAAIIGFLANPGGFPGLALSIMAGVTGVIQLAAIKKEPIPKAAKGMRVNSPTLLQAGEAGPEIVLSNKIVGSKSLGPIADDLARIQEGKQPRFLGQPNMPNFGGMNSAIKGVASQTVQNTVITNNMVDNKSINLMAEKIQLMEKNLEKFTTTIEKIKYLRAVITNDDLRENDKDEEIRMRYSSF